MKKLTTSVLAVVLSSSFAMLSAQEKGADTTNIREVVVTGAMGIKKKQDAVVSSNKVVAAQELTQASAPNAVQALTGKVSGLVISSANNSVNSTMNINLRGARTITGGTSPMVVIDGAVSQMAVFQQLPPEVIESVNVLKGQQGAALYGPLASNGAIIVTTKRGAKSEKIQFTLSSSIEASNIYKLPKLQQRYGAGYPGDTNFPSVGGTNYVPWENTNWGPAYSEYNGQELIQGLPDADGNFLTGKYAPIKNNMGDFFGTGVQYQNTLSMSVGGPDSYAFLSLNRLENNFIIDGDKNVRNSFTFKGGKKIDKFRIDGAFTYIDSNTKQSTADLWYELLNLPTNVDIRRYSNRGLSGNYTWYGENPYWLRDNKRNRSNSSTLNATMSLAYDFNEHISLSYRANLITQGTEAESWNNTPDNLYSFNAPGFEIDGKNIYTYQTRSNSAYGKSMTKYWKYYGDLMLNFDYDLTDDISLKANVGFNMTDTKNEEMNISGTGLDIPGWYNIRNVLSPANFSNLVNANYRTRSQAGFVNADLGYKDYLFLNATFRYEMSSLLSRKIYANGQVNPLDNKGFYYPSVGLSFIATKAIPSLKSDVLNYAKLSGSWVKTGNANVGIYGMDQIGAIPTGYPFGSLSSFVNATTQYDPNLTPEFLNTWEGNISLGFFNDRITLDGSVYRTKTLDMITGRTTSNASGISTRYANIGDLVNKGYEIELGVTPFKTKDFRWTLTGSYSTYKTTVESLADNADEINIYTPYASFPVGIFAVKGEQMPVIKGTAYVRDPNGNIVVDADGLPLVDSKYKVLGKVNPDYILNFSTQISYKGLTLSAVADYRTGNSFYSATKRYLAFTGGLEKSGDFDRTLGYVIPGSVQNTGTAANPVYTPNITPVNGTASYASVHNYFSDTYTSAVAEEFIVDGTALKIREIALSYKLPKDILRGTFVNDLTFGFFARNPFAWYAKSNRNFADPETSVQTGNAAGIAHTSQIPISRTYGFNINLTF